MRHNFLRNLEVDLPLANPHALEEIHEAMRKAGTPVSTRDFRDTLLDALERPLSSSPAPGEETLCFHPWGSDNTMLADVSDLVTAMGRAVGRPVTKFKAPVAPLSTRLLFALSTVCCKPPRAEPSKPRSTSSLTRRFSTITRSSSFSSNRSLGVPTYFMFISYYREEAGCDARLLQLLLQKRLKHKRVYLDSTDADDIRKILSAGVACSDTLLFVQTSGVLTRPWCLLEVYTALRNNVPVLPLVIEGSGYDFGQARDFLENLEPRLEAANPGAFAQLSGLIADGAVPIPEGTRAASVADLQETLSKAIPFLISGCFQPLGSEHQLSAAVQDIVSKAKRAVERSAKAKPEEAVRSPSAEGALIASLEAGAIVDGLPAPNGEEEKAALVESIDGRAPPDVVEHSVPLAVAHADGVPPSGKANVVVVAPTEESISLYGI